MSKCPLFPAPFIADTLNEKNWTVSDPIAIGKTEFWYGEYKF